MTLTRITFALLIAIAAAALHILGNVLFGVDVTNTTLAHMFGNTALLLSILLLLLVSAVALWVGISGLITSLLLQKQGNTILPRDNKFARMLFDFERDGNQSTDVSFCALNMTVMLMLLFACIAIAVTIILWKAVIGIAVMCVFVYGAVRLAHAIGEENFAQGVFIFVAALLLVSVGATFYDDIINFVNYSVKSIVTVSEQKLLPNLPGIVLVVSIPVGVALFAYIFKRTTLYDQVCPRVNLPKGK